jgi:hypothetical protein
MQEASTSITGSPDIIIQSNMMIVKSDEAKMPAWTLPKGYFAGERPQHVIAFDWGGTLDNIVPFHSAGFEEPAYNRFLSLIKDGKADEALQYLKSIIVIQEDGISEKAAKDIIAKAIEGIALIKELIGLKAKIALASQDDRAETQKYAKWLKGLGINLDLIIQRRGIDNQDNTANGETDTIFVNYTGNDTEKDTRLPDKITVKGLDPFSEDKLSDMMNGKNCLLEAAMDYYSIDKEFISFFDDSPGMISRAGGCGYKSFHVSQENSLDSFIAGLKNVKLGIQSSVASLPLAAEQVKDISGSIAAVGGAGGASTDDSFTIKTQFKTQSSFSEKKYIQPFRESRTATAASQPSRAVEASGNTGSRAQDRSHGANHSAGTGVEVITYTPTITSNTNQVWARDLKGTNEEAITKIKSRSNKINALEKLYQKDEAKIQDSLLSAIVAACYDMGLKLDKVTDFNFITKAINYARENGGISNVVDIASGNYEQNNLDSSEDFKKMKIFSKKFQQNCEKLGIYSGREGGKGGLRLTFIPDEIAMVFNRNSKLDEKYLSRYREIFTQNTEAVSAEDFYREDVGVDEFVEAPAPAVLEIYKSIVDAGIFGSAKEDIITTANDHNAFYDATGIANYLFEADDNAFDQEKIMVLFEVEGNGRNLTNLSSVGDELKTLLEDFKNNLGIKKFAMPIHLNAHFTGIYISKDYETNEEGREPEKKIKISYFDPSAHYEKRTAADDEVTHDLPEHIEDLLKDVFGESIAITKTKTVIQPYIEEDGGGIANNHCGAFVGFFLNELCKEKIKLNQDGYFTIGNKKMKEKLTIDESDELGRYIRKQHVSLLNCESPTRGDDCKDTAILGYIKKDLTIPLPSTRITARGSVSNGR